MLTTHRLISFISLDTPEAMELCLNSKKLIGKKALSIDTTDEFDGLGTLHPATGPIKEAQELAAKAFGAKKTFFLLNGSTAGNLALAMALTKHG